MRKYISISQIKYQGCYLTQSCYLICMLYFVTLKNILFPSLWWESSPAGVGKDVNNLLEASGVTLGLSGKARVTAEPACTLKGRRAWISTPLMLGRFGSGPRAFQGFFVPWNQGNFSKTSDFYVTRICRNSYWLQLLWDESTAFRSQPCLFLLCEHSYKNLPFSVVTGKSKVAPTLWVWRFNEAMRSTNVWLGKKVTILQ